MAGEATSAQASQKQKFLLGTARSQEASMHIWLGGAESWKVGKQCIRQFSHLRKKAQGTTLLRASRLRVAGGARPLLRSPSLRSAGNKAALHR